MVISVQEVLKVLCELFRESRAQEAGEKEPLATIFSLQNIIFSNKWGVRM